VVLLSLALFLLAPGTPAQSSPSSGNLRAGDLFLVLPFEPTVRTPQHAWLGDGLGELFSSRLAEDGRLVFPRNDWIAALEKLGLPPSTRFTRATMLKVAQQMDADYVIFGEYGTDGKRLTLTARVLQISPGRLSPPFTEAGALDDLMNLQGRAAWQVMRFVDSTFPLSQAGYVQRFSKPRMDAFEQYIRGLSAGDEQRLRLLREAARLDADWVDPSFALGEAYYVARNCEPALIWLSRVPPGHLRGIEAGFEAGVCHLLRHDPARAESAFQGVLFSLNRKNPRIAPPGEVLNNLAIALSRRGQAPEAAENWQRAQQADEGQGDYWFNAAVGFFRAAQYGAGARVLRELLKRNPEDGEARAFLVAMLEKAGRATEAAAVREECTSENCGGSAALTAALRDLALTPRPGAPDSLAKIERISYTLDASAFLFAARAVQESENSPARSREHFEIHLARGRKSLEEGKTENAQRDFSEAVLLAPDSVESRVALADVYRRTKRYSEAERELRAALWGRENVDVRLRLAELYMERGMDSEARNELAVVLRAEPSHAAARRLLDSLSAKGVSR